jgi:integrase
MSIYFDKRRGYKFDFTLNGTRQTSRYFETKREAKQEEAKRREEILNPPQPVETSTDMVFLELVNLRLDHLKAYNSGKHYQDTFYSARKWAERWGTLKCCEITPHMVRDYLLERRKISPMVANKELRYLRSAFNFAVKEGLIESNVTEKMSFFPIEKRVKYVPLSGDVQKVIDIADQDTQDYLWTIWETLGRMSEINRLTWEDVNLHERFVILYTRKKKGGNLTPRKVAMTEQLFDVLSRRHQERDSSKPWVFWHRYWSRKDGEWKEGPYADRKKFMKTLCRKAKVRYHRFHALRHSGASIMDNSNVPMGAIQEILGHENRTTTELYLHSLSGTAQKAMATYEQAKRNSHSDSHSKEKGVADCTQQLPT